jgi:hypothetical protein
LKGYRQGADYFYQINDDTTFLTDDWEDLMVSWLLNSPALPNFGVTGPIDLRFRKLLTHSFAHRTHIDIFGRWFPKGFKNWWSDDWLTAVYGPNNTFRSEDVQVRHQGLTPRYKVDGNGRKILNEELKKGKETITQWVLQRFSLL